MLVSPSICLVIDNIAATVFDFMATTGREFKSGID